MLSPRDQRALVLGAAVLAPTLVLVLAVKPYVGRVAAAREELRAERALLERERELIAADRALASRAQRIDAARRAALDRLLPGSDALLAQGELATRIRGAARDAGVLIREVAGEGVERLPDGFLAVDVGLRAEGDFEGALSLLRKLESSRTLFHVRRLGIEAIRMAGADGGPDMEVLAIVATVRAYLLDPAGADALHSAPAEPASGRTFGVSAAAGLRGVAPHGAGSPDAGSSGVVPLSRIIADGGRQ